MVELRPHDMTAIGIRRVIESSPIATSRVWLCTTCGAKVFFGKVVSCPNYRCLCGGRQWEPSR